MKAANVIFDNDLKLHKYSLNKNLLVCRSNLKPPMGKGTKKDSRKRSHTEEDELDPMDPSSYSDAPRGGWYVVHVSGVICHNMSILDMTVVRMHLPDNNAFLIL